MSDQMYWTPQLSLGVKELDDQHKELIEKVNNLVKASEAGKSIEGILPLIDFLTGYVDSHFAKEEALMGKSGYPNASEHEKEHRIFQKTLEEFKRELAREGLDPEAQKAFNAMVIDWLFQHICEKDRDFGQFMGVAR